MNLTTVTIYHIQCWLLMHSSKLYTQIVLMALSLQTEHHGFVFQNIQSMEVKVKVLQFKY